MGLWDDTFQISKKLLNSGSGHTERQIEIFNISISEHVDATAQPSWRWHAGRLRIPQRRTFLQHQLLSQDKEKVHHQAAKKFCEAKWESTGQNEQVRVHWFQGGFPGQETLRGVENSLQDHLRPRPELRRRPLRPRAPRVHLLRGSTHLSAKLPREERNSEQQVLPEQASQLPLPWLQQVPEPGQYLW